MPEASQHKVLVVDDAPATRYALARALRAEGFETVEAATGAEALALAAGASAVVLDVHLPDMNGMEVCRQLRSQPATADLPIVHVSGVYITGHARALGEQAGADAYLLAPANPRELADTLNGLIRSKGRPRP